jgi:zinc/manganese transport system substrate-binding protein
VTSQPQTTLPPANPANAATETSTQLSTGKIKVIVTFSFLGDIVQNVAGDKADIVTLVGPDGDTHDYEPTPLDASKVADAQVVFEVGQEFESWLDNLYTASGSQAVRVVTSKDVTAEEEHADEHGEFDPHVWQNPKNVEKMALTIASGLSTADPANAATYTANAEVYIARLQALDKEIDAIVSALPADKRKIVTSHDALGYFAERYGFIVIGSVISALSTEAGDPSAQDIAKLVEAIRAEGVKAIFLESMANPRLVERVAQEAGVTVGPPLYTDALGPAGSDGTTYIDAMRHNAKALVDALK